MLEKVIKALNSYPLDPSYLVKYEESLRLPTPDYESLLNKDPSITRSEGTEVCNYFGQIRNDEPEGYGVMVMRIRSNDEEDIYIRHGLFVNGFEGYFTGQSIEIEVDNEISYSEG